MTSADIVQNISVAHCNTMTLRRSRNFHSEFIVYGAGSPTFYESTNVAKVSVWQFHWIESLERTKTNFAKVVLLKLNRSKYVFVVLTDDD